MNISFSISINDDNIFEENENFTLAIYQSLPTGVIVGNPGQATVTIVDNDCKLSQHINFLYAIIST